ncbi:cyclic nucleotide-gated cation channel beta-1-like [Centropristis striata]|uniref:cyclic nucleotide-gated cation channel beta-1-like n=1 Tax=Centropristis striata TaxID=184440 RepID=UPI0027E0E24B|nr:cyclic nucleotide-gated cation channel beta-1-like [Centropristis striata]
MMGWIVCEIGRMLPQPVQRQESGSDEVQSIRIVQKKTELVLEDIGQDEDKQQDKDMRQETQSRDKPLQTEETDERSLQMDSIKKETGEAVLVHLEDRLQQDRLEAAREAEEMACKAAEEAVRQLEVEHSAKIVIESLPESNEQLPNILEEENEDDPESLDVCSAEDENSPSSTDVEPASERRELESPPSQTTITQQPQAAEPEPAKAPEPGPKPAESQPSAATTDQTNAAEGDCGVPDLCSPIKSFVLGLPFAAVCLERCRKLLHDENLTPPKLSLPSPPPEFALLTQELSQQLSQLPKQARQCCMSLYRCFTGQNPNSQHPQQP